VADIFYTPRRAFIRIVKVPVAAPVFVQLKVNPSAVTAVIRAKTEIAPVINHSMQEPELGWVNAPPEQQ
jgi:hypothetical protein